MHASPVTPKAGTAARRRLRRRFAAIVALGVPVAMVVVVAVALAGDIPIAGLAVVLVLVANAAVWFALTERSALRAFGAVAAALAVAGLVVVLVTHWQGLVVLIVLLLLLALFGMAARYALERTGEVAVSRAATAVVAVGAAGSAALIINLKSGGGKAERFDLAWQARRRGIEPIVLEPGDDLLELAEDAIARGARVIGMAGGDGSQALVATVAARRDIAHVCVPAGTRNHFALDLGLDRDDVVGALDAFTDGVERRIDLASVNDRVFVNNASLGVYAKVVQSEAYRDAKLGTWTRMLPDLLGPDAEPIDLELTLPDGTICDDAPLVLVSNNPYELTHLSGAGTRADRHGDARHRRSGTGGRRYLQARGARAGRSGGALSRPAVVVRGGARGPLGCSRGDRPRRRGARARGAVALRIHARGAAGAAAPSRGPLTCGPRGGAHDGEPEHAAASGGRTVRRSCLPIQQTWAPAGERPRFPCHRHAVGKV